MVSRLVRRVGSYSITRDERGVYYLLDDCAREVAAGLDMEAIEKAAAVFADAIHVARICAWCKVFLGVIEGNPREGAITHGICEPCATEMEET